MSPCREPQQPNKCPGHPKLSLKMPAALKAAGISIFSPAINQNPSSSKSKPNTPSRKRGKNNSALSC